jgi:hypothetical protein
VLVLGIAAGAIVAVSPRLTSSPPKDTFSGPAPLAQEPRDVALTRADRRAIDGTLDRFVPWAVARKDLPRAYDVVTPSMRSGETRGEWSKGNIPVLEFPARGRQFHGWPLNFSSRNEANVDLLIQPREGADRGPIAFTIGLKRLSGRWLVDSIVPSAIFPKAGARGEKAHLYSVRDTAPQPTPNLTKGRIARGWLYVVIGGLLGLVVLLPVAVIGVNGYRARKAERDWAAGRV